MILVSRSDAETSAEASLLLGIFSAEDRKPNSLVASEAFRPDPCTLIKSFAPSSTRSRAQEGPAGSSSRGLAARTGGSSRFRLPLPWPTVAGGLEKEINGMGLRRDERRERQAPQATQRLSLIEL